jgi:hypothetical protein
MNIDEELKIALRREEPPEGFAERVLARLPETRENVVPFRPRRTTALLSGIAAAALLGAFGSLAFMLPRRAEPVGEVAVAPPTVPVAPPHEEPYVAPPIEQGSTGTPGRVPVKYHAPRQKRRAERPVVDKEGERAVQQLLLALQVTGDKLSTVRQSVRDSFRDGLVERRAR